MNCNIFFFKFCLTHSRGHLLQLSTCWEATRVEVSHEQFWHLDVFTFSSQLQMLATLYCCVNYASFLFHASLVSKKG